MYKKGLKENYIFTYSIEHLAKKDKVRYYYALKGRDGKSGILHKTKAQQLGRTVLLIPKKHELEFREFFKYWKCKFKVKKVYLE